MLSPFYEKSFNNWVDQFDSESMSWREFENTFYLDFDDKTWSFSYGNEDGLSYEELLVKSGKASFTPLPLFVKPKDHSFKTVYFYNLKHRKYCKFGTNIQYYPTLDNNSVIVGLSEVVKASFDEWLSTDSNAQHCCITLQTMMLCHWIELLKLVCCVNYDATTGTLTTDLTKISDVKSHIEKALSTSTKLRSQSVNAYVDNALSKHDLHHGLLDITESSVSYDRDLKSGSITINFSTAPSVKAD
jgi:hypothetical protein